MPEVARRTPESPGAALAPEAFVTALLRVPPREVESFVREARPRPYAWRRLHALTQGCSPTERECRATLVHVWGVHGRHAPAADGGESLVVVLARLTAAGRVGGGTLARLLHATRPTLRGRLVQAALLLAHAEQGFDYAGLLADVTYFGPRVQGRWTREVAGARTRQPAAARDTMEG